MMRLSQPNGTPQGISGGKDHQKHLDISVTQIRFNLLRITRILTETDLNMQPWPGLHLISSNNMRKYTHVPSSARRASTGSADGWTTWTVGGKETERRHAAGPAPKSAKHRHTAMQQLPCVGHRQKQEKQEKRQSMTGVGAGEKEREREREREHQYSPEIHWDKVKNMTQHERIQCDNERKFSMRENTSRLLYVSFLMCWCLSVVALLAKCSNS